MTAALIWRLFYMNKGMHVVADYEGRSANSQILILIRDAIEKYEEKHGKIEL